jgi:hypothetical protein
MLETRVSRVWEWTWASTKASVSTGLPRSSTSSTCSSKYPATSFSRNLAQSTTCHFLYVGLALSHCVPPLCQASEGCWLREPSWVYLKVVSCRTYLISVSTFHANHDFVAGLHSSSPASTSATNCCSALAFTYPQPLWLEPSVGCLPLCKYCHIFRSHWRLISS